MTPMIKNNVLLTTLALLAAATVPCLAQKNKNASSLPAPNAKVAQVKKGMAASTLRLAIWCKGRKLMRQANQHVDEALLLDPANVAAQRLKPKLTGASTGGLSGISDGTRRLYAKKLATLQKSIQRQRDYMLKLELRAAMSGPVLRKAGEHPLEYIISLPRGWTPRKTWPILVTVEGAGCNWLGNHRAFLKNRGKLGLIIVTPITFWNTNSLNPKKYNYPKSLVESHDRSPTERMRFDEEGLLAALQQVQKDCNGEKKFFITGFSGGGNLTWRMVFGHPDKLRGAAPSCANFSMPGQINRTAEEREQLPVRAFQGEKDKHLDGKNVNLNAQWKHALRLCTQNGYKNVKREMLPGVGHSTCKMKVLSFVEEVLKTRK